MLFKNDEASLKLDIVNYEFPDGGMPGTSDCNWLVLRGTYREGKLLIVDSNSCLTTTELQMMTAGLKILNAGIRNYYQSNFLEPYFELDAAESDKNFKVEVSFAFPNTMEDIDHAELECTMSKAELKALIDELDRLCMKFPSRK